MESMVAIVAVKTAAALLLALTAAVAGRYVKRPALTHLLWIVVLLELLVPPLFEVGVLPRTVLPARVAEAAITFTAPPIAAAPDPMPTLGSAEPRPATGSRTRILPLALGSVWAAGSLVLLLVALGRMRRFTRLLGDTTAAPAELRAAGDKLAARLGLSSCPPIRIVPASISPMLRPRLGTLELLFPAALLTRLRHGERDALVAHELAHVRRRDHWVRLLELSASALFWWHPVVWWARWRLRQAEERCCDDLVLATLPDHARDYAKGLVKTVEFLATSRPGLPALASGIGGARILEERLTMIMNSHRPKNLSRPQRLLLALAAGALLVVFPTWADRSPDSSTEKREQEQRIVAREAETRESLLALEHEAQELELALREVRARQHELQTSLRRQREELEINRLEFQAAKNDAAGLAQQAEDLRREQEWLREQAQVEAERERIEQDVERAIMAEEADIRRMMLEAEVLAQAEDRQQAEQFERDALEAQARTEAIVWESRRRQEKLERQLANTQLDRLQERISVLQNEDKTDEAAELRRELARLQIELELRARELRQHDRQRAIEHELQESMTKMQHLEAEGRLDEAAELERRIEALARRLERRDSVR